MTKLKQQFSALQDTVEQRQGNSLKNYLSADFTAMNKYNRAQFILFTRHQLKRNSSISVSVLDKDIKLYENYADITATVLLLGSSSWLPERGQVYSVASRWKKEKGEWLMSRLRWEIKQR